MAKTKTIIVALIGSLLVLSMLAGCSNESGPSADKNALHGGERGNDASAASTSEYSTGIHHATLEVEGYDPIVIELDADAAPITVENFCDLANDGFYDGLSFYRFQDGFCIQGGSSNYSAAQDPNSDEKTIKGEFSINGVDNELAENFKRGTVAMARSSDPDSAATTFFITMASDDMVATSLNGQYAAFGTIDERGMEVMDQMMADYSQKVDDPMMGIISDKEDQAIITSIKITD